MVSLLLPVVDKNYKSANAMSWPTLDGNIVYNLKYNSSEFHQGPH